MYDVSLAPRLVGSDGTEYGLGVVLIVDPNFYYLQTFAKSCLSLPTSAEEFVDRYGSIPGLDVNAMVAFFQGLNEIGSTFGTLESLPADYLQQPLMPTSLLGQCNFIMGAENAASVRVAARNFSDIASGLLQFLQANAYGSETPDYTGKNQRMVVQVLETGGDNRQLPLWQDVVISISNTVGGVQDNFKAYGTRFDEIMSAHGLTNSQLTAALQSVQNAQSFDGYWISMLQATAKGLRDKYNQDMAIIDAIRDPKTYAAEIALLGPFGGSLLHVVSHLISDAVAKDAQDMLAAWTQVEQMIANLDSAVAKMATFVRDLTGLNDALAQARNAITSMYNSLGMARWGYYIPTGNIAAYNLNFFTTTGAIDELLEITPAITGWATICDLASQFPYNCQVLQAIPANA